MLSGQKMPKKAEKWPKHHQIFWRQIGFETTPEKKAPFLPIGGRYLAEIVKKNRVFGDFEKAKFSKFEPKLAEKQHLLKKFFLNFNN